MSVTEQLDKYMDIHKCKISDIARFSGVPYTTIKGLYDKGDENIKLSTLKKLRTLLNCTLDELVGLNVQDGNFTYEERLLLSKFNKLTPANQKALLLSIDVLLTTQSEKEEITSA
jgi:DNA-binding Xre family transcriptional regulator